tara:strand:- start:2871 stop:3773 length:903 start_codon:yes stop_codon:yes gene_type:complete
METRKKNIGIFGIGAIGSIISLELHSNLEQNALFFFNRSPREAIKLKKANSEIELDIQLSSSKAFIPELDWIIICLKQYQIQNALSQIKNLIHSQTKLAIVRNGLRLKEDYLRFCKEENIIECSIDCSVQYKKSNSYEYLKDPVISVAKSKLGLEFSSLFKFSNCRIKQLKDFHSMAWKKLCESSALGAVLCLREESCWVFKDLKNQILYSDILAEGIAVAREDGAFIESDFMDTSLKKVLSYPENKGSSMLTDFLMGRPVELSAKNKLISEIGEIYGISTPVNDRLTRIIEAKSMLSEF